LKINLNASPEAKERKMENSLKIENLLKQLEFLGKKIAFLKVKRREYSIYFSISETLTNRFLNCKKRIEIANNKYSDILNQIVFLCEKGKQNDSKTI
jgi:hypothetical protein